MKRLLVFVGDDYYPFGGTRDLFSNVNSLDEIKTELAKELKKFICVG